MPRTPRATDKSLAVTSSRHFSDWLHAQRASLAITTYQSGKLLLLGTKPDGRLAVFERTFNRCMGLAVEDRALWMSSRFQVWRFQNVLPDGEQEAGYDALYVPQRGQTTGDIDIHDMVVDRDGRLVFVCTLFNSLCTLSDTHSFTPLWQPPFISKLTAEDRCHLNGLALRDGLPRYVTVCGTSDVVDGWRDQRQAGGIVIDLASNEIVARGLSMPHSPRYYQDRLWLLNSGTGEFGTIDLATRRFEPLTFCPGYARGLAFVDHFAIVGLSDSRHEPTFSGLPLDANLAGRGAVARCGLAVIDLRSGDTVHWVRIGGPVRELYDVTLLPGVARPKALGFQTDEIARRVSVEVGGQVRSWFGGERT